MSSNDTKNMEDKVYNDIKKAILKRKYLPDNQLVEATIAEKLGVSRTPIRSALKRLAYEGLVTIIPQKGAFVSKPTIEEFVQVFSCRMILEKEAARLAAEKISQGGIEQLEKLNEKLVECYESQDLEAFIKHNNTLHMIIANASGNNYFAKFVEELLLKSSIYLIFFDKFYSKSAKDSEAIQSHKCLIEALKTKDSDKCANIMEEHIRVSFKNLNGNILGSINSLLKIES